MIYFIQVSGSGYSCSRYAILKSFQLNPLKGQMGKALQPLTLLYTTPVQTLHDFSPRYARSASWMLLWAFISALHRLAIWNAIAIGNQRSNCRRMLEDFEANLS